MIELFNFQLFQPLDSLVSHPSKLLHPQGLDRYHPGKSNISGFDCHRESPPTHQVICHYRIGMVRSLTPCSNIQESFLLTTAIGLS